MRTEAGSVENTNNLQKEKKPDLVVWRDMEFWVEEIKKAGIFDKLGYFNSTETGNTPPRPELGFGDPILIDVILDGKKTDIYNTDSGNLKNPLMPHRLFFHIKE